MQARDLWGNPRTDNGDADAAYTDGRSSLASLASFKIICLCVRVAGLPCECRLPSLEYSRSGAGAEDLEEHDAFNVTLTLISQY